MKDFIEKTLEEWNKLKEDIVHTNKYEGQLPDIIAEKFLRSKLQELANKHREELKEWARKTKEEAEDGRYRNEGERWLNGYDCAMYDLLTKLNQE